MKLVKWGILLFLVGQSAIAKEVCRVPNYVKDSWRGTFSGCFCPTDEQKRNAPEKFPDSFKLDAVCDIYSGTYYLSGKMTLKGEIMKFFAESDGDTTTFSSHQLSGSLGHFMFDTKNINEDKVFSIPKYINNINCVKAPATIIVNSFNVDFDSNDSSGAYIQNYKLVSMGKFRSCKVGSF